MNIFKKGIFRYILGVVLLAPFIYYAGSNSLANLVKPQLQYIFLSLCFTALAYYIDSVRWGIITNKIARKKVCSYKDYFLMYSSSMSIGQFISQAGGMFVLRPLMLKKKYGLRYHCSYIAIIVEKSADFFFLLIFLSNSFLYFFLISNMKIIIAILFISIIISYFLYKNYGFIFEKSIYFFLKKYNKYLKSEDVVLNETRFEHTRNSQLYSKIAVMSILRIFAFSLRLFFLVYGINITISYLVILLGIPVGQLSLLFSFTPGAIGVLEGGWFGVLKVANVPKEIIGNFLVGQRFYWIVFSLLTLGLCYLLNKLNFAFPFDDSTP